MKVELKEAGNSKGQTQRQARGFVLGSFSSVVGCFIYYEYSQRILYKSDTATSKAHN